MFYKLFGEASMAKAVHVVRFLGQNTHRAAISNNRVLSVSGTELTFIAKDYRE